MVGPEVVELAPGVRHAARLSDTVFEQRLVAGIVVADQLALPAADELFRVAPAAGFSEVVDDALDVVILRRAPAPQVSLVRLAVAGLQHRHRCLIGMQHLALEQHRFLCIDQRLQANAAHADPLSQRRSRDRIAGTAEHLFLPVERRMIRILRDQHLRKQSGSRDALVDHLRGHRCLDQRLAFHARPLPPHVPLDLEHARRVVELLADVFADTLQLAAAVAGRAVRLVANLDARQARGERFTFGLLFGRRRNRRCQLQIVELCLHRLEVGIQRFLEQASLLAVQLFAARGELPAPEHCHLVRQLIDLHLAAMQLPIAPLDLGFVAADLVDQFGSESAQLLRIHGRDLLVQFHERDGAIR